MLAIGALAFRADRAHADRPLLFAVAATRSPPVSPARAPSGSRRSPTQSPPRSLPRRRHRRRPRRPRRRLLWRLAAARRGLPASLIGFAVLAARRPNVFGSVVGAIFVGVLLNGLTMLNVPYYTQDFVKGAVLRRRVGADPTASVDRRHDPANSPQSEKEPSHDSSFLTLAPWGRTRPRAVRAFPALAAGLSGAPAPFDKGGVKLRPRQLISAATSS